MKQYICRVCGYVFSAENAEPDYDKLVETDEPMDAPDCPQCGGPGDSKED